MSPKTNIFRRVFAGVLVNDLDAARAWYERVLGRAPDAAPMEGLLEWHLTENGWLQVVNIQNVRDIQRQSAWGAAGSSSVAFVVERLDDQLAVLEANKVPVGPMYTTPHVKTATTSDPSGNLVTFVEELG